MSDTEKEETLEENSQEFETPVNSSDNPDTDKVKAAEIAELDIEKISQVIDKQAETASPRENHRGNSKTAAKQEPLNKSFASVFGKAQA